MKIAVILPEYNEKDRAVRTINEVLKQWNSEVMVVDDGSEDGSFQMLNNAFGSNKRVTILKHEINLGKGAAMKTGVKKAVKMGMDAVIFIDADGQHHPRHLKEFERFLADYDLVLGYRELNGEIPWVRRIGNILSLSLIKSLFNIKRLDLLCGYFGFKLKIYQKIKWGSSRYGVETEIAARAGKNRIDFKEIKVETIYIDKYKGVTIFDAVRILLKIPFWYFEK